MTTYYLDPESGNNSADGLSFANRWKTFSRADDTAAAGDVVRVIASPEPSLLGDAAWTDNSTAIALAAAKTATIENCQTAWTPSTNVTSSTTTSGGHKIGTACTTITIASGFTTGKVAYKALAAPLDLSGYQQVSLWIKSSYGIEPGGFELRLCSDAAGDVAVNSVPIPNTTTVWFDTYWQVVQFDFGAALGAGINSIALYALKDPYIQTVSLSNIIATAGRTDPNCLTHLSLVGKNTLGESEWYPLLSIDGTAVTLGAAYDTSVASPARPYRGTTETVSTYARQPLVNVEATHGGGYIDGNGAFKNPVVYSGGWDRTDMSAQTGQTWLSGAYCRTYKESLLDIGGNNLIVTGIGLCHHPLAGFSGWGNNLTLEWLGFVACGQAGYLQDNAQGTTLDFGKVTHCPSGIIFDSGGLSGAYRIGSVEGATATAVTFDHFGLEPLHVSVGKISNCGGAALRSSGNVIFHDVVIGANVAKPIFDFPTNYVLGPVTVVNGTFPSAPTFTNAGMQARLHRYNGGADDHRVIMKAYTVASDSAVRHADSGVAWKATVTSIADQAEWLFPLAKAAVGANTPVTVKCWVRRDNAALDVGIRVRGGELPGVSTTVSASITAAADAWEEITISFTPNEAGVVEIFGHFSATATGHSGWWDDLTVAQA